jgi:hypothetical protein
MVEDLLYLVATDALDLFPERFFILKNIGGLLESTKYNSVKKP